jgi:lysyl endopeptidase
LFYGGNMKKMISILAFASLSVQAHSIYSFPSLDVEALHQKELSREVKGEAPHFAVPRMVSINPLMNRDWTEVNGQLVWQAEFSAPNAVSLNFGFTDFKLSSGAKLEIFSADMSKVMRAFTAADNNIQNELWTPVIMSDAVVIKFTIPKEEFSLNTLNLTRVNQGFRTFAEKTAKAGACNVDVACSDGDSWRDEINSVAVISTGGSTFCTGFMVNNTANDRTPYFMTAHHCRINATSAPSLVTYWNYQSSRCGGARNGTLNQFNTGSRFLSSSAKSDFALVRLNSSPNKEWGVTYAGWDNSGTDASSAVAIHHPNTDEKSISFENDPTTVTDYLGSEVPGNGTHVRVEDWDKGTTEPGSSGSPLFNQDHRVIGQLHGGWASCSSQTADYYGRIYTSWEGDGSASTRLKDHLDARNTGASVTDTLR